VLAETLAPSLTVSLPVLIIISPAFAGLMVVVVKLVLRGMPRI
jgi:hypothetical protein